MGAYGEAGPWGVWLDMDGLDEPRRWYQHRRGGPMPFTEEHARALADTLNRSATNGRCEARPLVWDGSKQEYAAR